MYQTLQIGDTGDDVKILQEKLKMLGFYNSIITGSFSLATEASVKAFQQYANLEVTGVVNQETWDTLIQYTEKAIAPISVYPTLSYGSTGSYVRDLQTKLTALLYYTDSINGNFDLETEIAVKRFQLNNDLTATGVVDSQTWNLLNNLYGNLNSCVLGDENTDTDQNYLTYTVQTGDTLYSIARKYNTTVNAIKELNNLTSDILRVGQVLKIPTVFDDDYITYTVLPNDTLYAIARRYNTSVDAIKNLNNLTSDVLKIGQILKIPTSNNSNYINYVVQRNDTLYAIARRYNTSVATIKSLNNLESDILTIGQVLKIPTTAGQNYITYTVNANDTLYSIARKYNTTVSAIKELNNLESDNLQIGQRLLIPV